jgi:hypothetical protein
MKLSKYRVVKDNYNGYEVQVWRWWFPFWCELGGTNSFESLEEAVEYAKCGGVCWESGFVWDGRTDGEQ